MKLSDNEHKLLELERKEYRALLGDIRRTRKTNRKDLSITCIGNAGGSDSIIHGKPSGGMLIRFNDRNIIVDPGNNSLTFLMDAGFDPYQVTDIIASHPHDDHVGDLTSFVSAALQLNLVSNSETNILVPPSLVDYENAEATRYGFTLPVYAWQGNVRTLYWKDTQAKRYDGKIVQTEKTASIGNNVKVTSIEGRHSNMQVSGYILSTPFGKLAYTGDTEYFPELTEQYKDVDLLWMNMNTLGLDSITDTECYVPEQVSFVKNHLGYAGVCELIDAVRPKTAIISHFGSQLLSKVDEVQNILRERFGSLGVNIYCVHTGDEFSFKESLAQKPDLERFLP